MTKSRKFYESLKLSFPILGIFKIWGILSKGIFSLRILSKGAFYMFTDSFLIQLAIIITFQELSTICDDLIAKVGTWQHRPRDFSLSRDRYRHETSSRNSNLGVNSKSQNHLNTDISHERPSLQRQGTFTETRKSRPHLRSTVITVISTRLVPVGHYQALLYQGNSPIELN